MNLTSEVVKSEESKHRQSFIMDTKSNIPILQPLSPSRNLH